MKKLLFTLIALVCSQALIAQSHMRIHLKNGGQVDIPVADIDSVTFVESGEEPSEEAELKGCWLWGDADAGYYELLTFNDDNTYTCYDNYFTYGFDTNTYGWYMQYGEILNLLSGGFGYNRRHTWYVTGLTAHKLDVMTRMGQFNYYKLQEETITIQLGKSVQWNEGDAMVFADGVVVVAEGNVLRGQTQGVTYIQIRDGQTNEIFAYKVIVEQAFNGQK